MVVKLHRVRRFQRRTVIRLSETGTWPTGPPHLWAPQPELDWSRRTGIATSLSGILHVRPRPRLLLSGMLDRLILPASRKQPVRILVLPNDDAGYGFEHRLTWGHSFRNQALTAVPLSRGSCASAHASKPPITLMTSL